MDEQRAWLRAKRKRRLRILAVILCVCVLFTTYPDILAALSVFASEVSEQSEGRYISGFTALSDEIKEQTVPVGTALTELLLPDTLEAVITEEKQPSEDTEDKSEESGREDAGENDGEETDGDTTDTEDMDGSAEETEEDEPSNTEQEDTETGGETEDIDTETGDGQDTQPEEDGESGETDGTTETGSDDAADTENEEGSEGSASSEEQQESAVSQETHTVTMQEYFAENVIPVQTLENTQTEKQEETVTIDGVTWQSEPEYDGSAEGTYTFTAVLPDGYALADGVSLPEITVTVENGTDAVIQALLDRIAALPDVEEYLATEPDMDDEDAYVEWEEKLYEYAEEALAIWEEYEALTEEQQAMIAEEELAKLTAWVELAETFSDHAVMLADDSEHHGESGWTALTASDTTLSGGKYYLSSDITMDTITVTGNVTLCLNGHTLTHDDSTDGSVIVVESGTFTLCDCQDDYTYSWNGSKENPVYTLGGSGGCITGGNGYNSQGGGVHVKANATFVMNSGRITECNVGTDAGHNGGGVYVATDAIFEMTGGFIENNAAGSGAGVCVEGCFSMSDEAVIMNNASGGGVGITSGSGSFTMRGGKIIGNTASALGGGVQGKLNATISMEGGLIEGNSAKDGGGGLSIPTNSPTKLSGGTIRYNRMSGSVGLIDAGGVRLLAWASTLELSGSISIYDNYYSDGTISNVFLPNNASVTIAGPLTNSVGITSQTKPQNGSGDNGVVVANENTSEDYDYHCIVSDENYRVIKSGSQILLAEWTGNPVTITAYKDGLEWVENPPTYKLTSDNGASFVTDLTAVPDGEYHVYEGDTDTGVTVKVDGAAATAEVYYHTVTFYDGSTALTTPAQQIVLKNQTASAPAETPTKTGYTFGKWVTADGGSTAYDFTKAVTGKTSVYASWTPQTYQVTFDYHSADGGNTTQSKTVTYDSTYGALPVPARAGYTFKGWYTEENGQGSKVDAGTTVTTTSAHTLHAYWMDETAPGQPVLQDGVTLPAGWTDAQDTIPLKLYDGVGVVKLLVSVDGNPYTEVNGFSAGTGSVSYNYAVLDGEHTYQFKAVDAADNASEESAVFTVRLDQTKPVIGTITYENKAADLWDWIIGKTSMIVHVPVTDTGSGVKQITYTLTPRDAAGNPDSSKALEKTAAVKDGEAKLTFDADFRGTITINCTDAAGNKADGVIIGKDAGGVIVEDHAPDITTDAKTDYYDTPTAVNVTVKDDTNNAVTAGIASVTYQVGDGTAKSVTVGTSALQAEAIFTIPASEIPTGITEIKITAKDNAGNEAAKSITIKVKGPEKQPAAEIGYREGELTGLVPDGVYSIGGTEYTADRQGHIPVTEGWFGNTVSIIKKGNGSETADSPAQSLPIPARPAAPDAPELSVRDDKSITLKTITGAQYRLADGTGNWQDSTAFTGLAQKTIYKFKAYYPATDTSFASPESGEAQIATMPTAPAKDKLEIGYTAETFRLTDGIEAFTDQSCTTPVTAGSVEAYMGQTLYIRYPVNGIIPASLTTAVPVPARPAKPVPGQADASYPGAKDGAITGLTSGTAYEYRVKDQNGSFGAWKDAALNGTRIENLPAGEYEVRVKAVETGNASFRSGAAAVIIGENPGVKITFMANGEECAIRYTRSGGTLTDIPSVPPKKDAGAQAFVGEWCADEQGSRPAVFTNINADMTVYAVYTEGYTVTLRGGTGYTLSAVNGSVSPVKEGGSFTFRFALAGGYQKSGSFAVKVNGVGVELTANEPYIYTITDIKKNQVVTVEGVTKRPDGGLFNPPGGSGDNEDDSEPATTPTEPSDNTPSTPPVNPPAKVTLSASATTPPAAEKEPKDRKSGTMPKQEKGEEQEPEGTEPQEPETDSADARQTEKEPKAEKEEVQIGNGTVIVTVVCEEEKCTATVADTEKVVKAVLTLDQQELVNGGETIEIRIDVTDISEKVPAQDKEVIESGIESYREEVPGLVLGMYVDISMFIKIGAGDWNSITATDEPIEVVVGIPEKLRSDGRKFIIIRAHEGEYTFMNDLDDAPDTITISTDMFSSYAIAYVETEGAGGDDEAKCGLCHICPTFLGICYFIWLAVFIALVLIIYIIWRKKRQKEEKQKK